MPDFLMPSLGADMDEGTLVEWKVRPGDPVGRGQVVAVVETAKGAIDVEIFQEGTIESLLVDEGATVPVGQPIARLQGGELRAPAPGKAEALAARPGTTPPARPRASPAARRRAETLGIALASIKGTGPDGAMTVGDVERAAAAAGAPVAAPAVRRPAAPEKEEAAAGAPDMRAVIAAAMARSKREIPHYYLANWVDLTPANEWLSDWNAAHPVEERLLTGVLMIRAVALAVARFPEFNGYFRDGAFAPSEGVSVGVAISLRRGGLIAPAIRDADKLTLPELMSAFRDLVARARAGRLTSSEIAGGSITVSSLGEQGVEEVFPVIYAPQVAIVGFGTPVERPWAVAGRIEPRWLVRATLAADHRVSDGHRGALFLHELTRRLQEPETL